MRNNNKILLHACCAICSAHPIQLLKEQGYEPIVYFYNPNIQPLEEYSRRLQAQEELCKKLACELIIETYETEVYNEIMVGYEHHGEGSERCSKCFELRLRKSAQKAQELNINKYTTSISISPHKDFNKIRSIGEFFSNKFKVEFMPFDFKKQDGFLKTNTIAKELNLYRQNYCGCEMSRKRLENIK